MSMHMSIYMSIHSQHQVKEQRRIELHTDLDRRNAMQQQATNYRLDMWLISVVVSHRNHNASTPRSVRAIVTPICSEVITNMPH